MGQAVCVNSCFHVFFVYYYLSIRIIVYFLLFIIPSKANQLGFNVSDICIIIIIIINMSDSPLLNGHLFRGHLVWQRVSRLFGGQQVSRKDTGPAEAATLVQGERVGLDQCLGQGQGLGKGLGRDLGLGLCLQVGLGERLAESLQLQVGLWGLKRRFEAGWWRLWLEV